MGITQSDLFKNIDFYKYAHNSGSRLSPEMILSAFDEKLDEKKDEIPPDACRPSEKLKKNNLQEVDPQKVKRNSVQKVDPKKLKKTNVQEATPPFVRPSGGPGGAAPREAKKVRLQFIRVDC